MVNGLYTPSASLLPRFAGERNPYQLTFCPQNKFKNLTVGIIRSHHKNNKPQTFEKMSAAFF